MYGILGNIQFRGAYSPSQLKSDSSANYAEHALIEGKPRLQKVGENLEQLALKMELHSSFCQPEQELSKLYRYKESGEIITLIFGNGLVYGSFVVEKIGLEYKAQLPTGSILSCSVDVSLKEAYNPREAVQSRASAFAVATSAPPLAASPVVLEQSISGEFSESINAAIVETDSVGDVLQQAENDPTLEAYALDRAGNSLDVQESALGKANALASPSDSPIFAASANFRGEIAGILGKVGDMRTALQNGLAPALGEYAAYQSTLSRLRALTTPVATLKALRR